MAKGSFNLPIGSGGGSGDNDKVKYDAGDPTEGYLSEKVVAGTGISIAEGTGANENKLVITNDDPGSSVSVPADISELTDTTNLLFSGDYDDLSNKPSIPADLSDLTDTTNLLFSGDYDDLSNKPTIPGDEKVKYNADDSAAGYLADKIIAGVGMAVAEGTGGDADKLVISQKITVGRTITDATDDLETTDCGKMIYCNRATSITLTIPEATLTKNVPVGIRTIGVGQVILAVANGTDQTINAAKKTPGQYTTISVECIDDTANAEVFIVTGGVE